LAAEITARTGNTPDVLFAEIQERLGQTFYARIDQPAGRELRLKLGEAKPDQLSVKELAGDSVISAINSAPGNDAPIGGIKISTKNGWIAARPSGTEDVYKIYAESFTGADHLALLQKEAALLIEHL
jgi:phosphoglucomutase